MALKDTKVYFGCFLSNCLKKHYEMPKSPKSKNKNKKTKQGALKY